MRRKIRGETAAKANGEAARAKADGAAAHAKASGDVVHAKADGNPVRAKRACPDFETVRRETLSRIESRPDADDETIHDIIDDVMGEQFDQGLLSVRERLKCHRDVFNVIRGYGILQDLIDDPDVTEIMVNGADHIFIEKNGKLGEHGESFKSSKLLADTAQRIAGRANRRVNESSPIADIRLEDGSRANIVLSPVALDGPVITIRKFPKEKMTMADLLRLGSVTPEAARMLEELVTAGFNIFVSGGTSSGKTTLLNILSDFIPEDERVVTIEDSAELQMRNIKNIVRLEARTANTEGENAVTIRDLIKASLRMRPDRIIVGEVRGGECVDMLAAMNTGHDGSMSTGHANSPQDMLSRLETMVLTGMDIPLPAVRGQIAAALDVIVHVERTRTKKRRISQITEVLGVSGGETRLNTIFSIREDENGEGILVRTGELKNTEKLRRAGVTEQIRPSPLPAGKPEENRVAGESG